MLTTRITGDSLAVASALAPTLAAVQQIPVDLDERAFLFPAGKPLTRIVFQPLPRHVAVEAVFAFNATRTAPRLFTLELDDARLLARTLVDAVFLARTQHAISETMRITVEVLTNGYRLQVGGADEGMALYFGTASVWRVCQALLRAVDAIAPVESN
jgi:hypothetical protein